MHILHGGPAGATYAIYGTREPALHAPLQLADETVRRAFLTPYFETAIGRESIRLALIVQGVFAATDADALWGQADHALKTGVLRIAPVPVSGLHPVKTEPARAALSGKPFIPPPRLNPTPTPPPPAPVYKLVVEIAGRRENRLPLDIHCRLVDRNTPRKHLAGFDSGGDAHRMQLEVHGLDVTPYQLMLGVPLSGGGVMGLPLGTPQTPVEKSVQRARWDTVLVPLVPFIYSGPQPSRAQAAPAPEGWLAMFVNGHLHREWWSSGRGTFRDVPLGAPDGVGDARRARGQPQDHLLAPHLLNGQPQKVELLYSRQPLAWATLMKLGGLAPDDARFNAEEKQRAANIAADEELRKQWFRSTCPAMPEDLMSEPAPSAPWPVRRCGPPTRYVNGAAAASRWRIWRRCSARSRCWCGFSSTGFSVRDCGIRRARTQWIASCGIRTMKVAS